MKIYVKYFKATFRNAPPSIYLIIKTNKPNRKIRHIAKCTLFESLWLGYSDLPSKGS